MKLKDLNFKVPMLKPRDPNQQVLANKKNAAGEHRDKKRENRDGEFKHKNMMYSEEALNEKKPAGAPDWHESSAPDAEGRFKDLSVNDLADWLIKTRKSDMRKINGSLQQQIIFNRAKNPDYAKKMESTREAVKRKLKD
jgi:hypothetical protein